MERAIRVRRMLTNHLVTGLAVLSTIIVLVPLVAILGYLIYKGASSLNWAFFTHVPVPVGEKGGGVANAIVGSGVVLALASAMGIPVGIAAGVYLAEYGRGCLRADCGAATAFFGIRRRRGAGHHDGAYSDAHDRRNAGDGSGFYP